MRVKGPVACLLAITLITVTVAADTSAIAADTVAETGSLPSSGLANEERTEHDPIVIRNLKHRKSKRSKSKRSKAAKKANNPFFAGNSGGAGESTLTLNVLNEAFNQPFGGFFVMVHNSDTTPLYMRGKESSDALATLAENGDPSALVRSYSGAAGVLSAIAMGNPMNDGPTFGGQTIQIKVTTTSKYPLVTIASMAINTNDCFVALNGVRLLRGMVLDTPGLDAGSEENNENCSSIPGPGCPDSGNTADRNGEGFVHVHRGVMGVADLTLDSDWRNPMMRVAVM
eukprot:scaffold84758_cov61-Attheya_sp.AAC.5